MRHLGLAPPGGRGLCSGLAAEGAEAGQDGEQVRGWGGLGRVVEFFFGGVGQGFRGVYLFSQ